MSDNVWLTTPELAQRLRLPTKTLDQWSHKKVGPRFAKIGRHRRYRLDDVIRWEEAQFGDAA